MIISLPFKLLLFVLVDGVGCDDWFFGCNLCHVIGTDNGI